MLTSTEDKKNWYYAMHTFNATICPNAGMTMSHVWGSAPANIILRNLCDITPLEAGYDKIQIKPQLGTLKNIKVKTQILVGKRINGTAV